MAWHVVLASFVVGWLAGMERPVERVLRLIALALSADEHEARNAALVACKLIREHGLEVRDPSERLDWMRKA